MVLFSRWVVSASIAKLWTITCQAPLSMGFSRQVYWSGLPFPPPGDLPDPGSKPVSPALTGGFFTTELRGKPCRYLHPNKCLAVPDSYSNLGGKTVSVCVCTHVQKERHRNVSVKFISMDCCIAWAWWREKSSQFVLSYYIPRELFFFFPVFLPINTSYSISIKQHSKGGFIGNFREDLIVLLKLRIVFLCWRIVEGKIRHVFILFVMITRLLGWLLLPLNCIPWRICYNLSLQNCRALDCFFCFFQNFDSTV